MLSIKYTTQRGFSLVELITIIIVLGIVAVVAIPRFSGTQTYAEFSFQQRLVSALRSVQIQSMYDTRANFCHKLNFANIAAAGINAGFGPAVAEHTNGNEALSCATTIDYSAPNYLRTANNELSSQGVDIQALDSGLAINSIEFNALGQPISSAGQCLSDCEISFIGEDTATVCISAQGYVHAC